MDCKNKTSKTGNKHNVSGINTLDDDLVHSLNCCLEEAVREEANLKFELENLEQRCMAKKSMKSVTGVNDVWKTEMDHLLRMEDKVNSIVLILEKVVQSGMHSEINGFNGTEFLAVLEDTRRLYELAIKEYKTHLENLSISVQEMQVEHNQQLSELQEEQEYWKGMYLSQKKNCLHDSDKDRGNSCAGNTASSERSWVYQYVDDVLSQKVHELFSSKQRVDVNEMNRVAVMDGNEKDEATKSSLGVNQDCIGLKDKENIFKNSDKRVEHFGESAEGANGSEHFDDILRENRRLHETLLEKMNKVCSISDEVSSLRAELERRRAVEDKLLQEVDGGSEKINALKEQLMEKNGILELTSSQLEERIRECAKLISLCERGSFMHSNLVEVAVLPEVVNFNSKATGAVVSNLESHVAYLKSEKLNSETILKKQIQQLENKISELQIVNDSYQKQLNTITTTYYTMFKNTSSLENG